MAEPFDDTEDDRPWTERAGESIKAGAESAVRSISQLTSKLPWEPELDPANPSEDYGGQAGPFGAEARTRAEAHPIAVGVGQAVASAPLTLTPGGVVAGVLGEAVAGGYSAEAEEAWQQDRDFNQESAFTNVGAGLLIGGGVAGLGAGASKVAKLGRNLFTEAEHAASARAAGDLLSAAPKAKGAGALTADEIARGGPDDPGVRYLRENSDDILGQLAAQKTEHAQTLLDTYGKVAALRQTPKELAEVIPHQPTMQAQWVTRARQEIGAALDEVDPATAAPLREKLAKLGDGDKPEQWFTRASELSDELFKAERRAAQEPLPIDDSPHPSPVSLAGMSLKQLGANADPTSFKQETLQALRTGHGGRNAFAADFGTSGRVAQKGQLEQGIQVELGPKGPVLVDGRHRLMVGREKGLTEVYGQVYQGRRRGQPPIYEGPIPIGEAP